MQTIKKGLFFLVIYIHHYVIHSFSSAHFLKYPYNALLRRVPTLDALDAITVSVCCNISEKGKLRSIETQTKVATEFGFLAC